MTILGLKLEEKSNVSIDVLSDFPFTVHRSLFTLPELALSSLAPASSPAGQVI